MGRSPLAPLPRTDMSLNDARSKLAGWHFGQESLTASEREILYVAEAVLRALDEVVGAANSQPTSNPQPAERR